MRVLMIEHFSAGNEYSIELCNKLSDYVDLTLLTVDNSKLKGSRPYVYKKKLCGYGHPFLKRVSRYVKGLWSTLRECICADYEMIHVQTFRIAPVEILMYAAMKLIGRKFVHTVHNVVPHESGLGDRLLYSVMYRISEALIVHNESSAKELEDSFKCARGKVRVIPHGTYDFYKGILVEEESEDDGRVRFLQMGKIRRYKGVETLVRAAGILQRDYAGRFEVIIAGKSEYDIDIEELAKSEGAQDCIRHMGGFLPSDEVAKLFKRCDACVFPYTNVYGSGALLLSYTFGLPVIASDIPTFIEETEGGSTGLIFKSEDSRDLAGKMARFIEMDRQVRDGYRREIEMLVREKYSWKNSALKTSRLYSEI